MLDTIQALKDEGLTQAEIGDVVDMSRSSIKDRMKIISDIGADILEKCKANQIGRAPTNGACAPFKP